MNIKVFPIFCIIAAILIETSYSARILYISNSFSRSHVIVSSNLLKELSTRGHEVTKISSFPEETGIKNFRNIYFPIKDEMNVLLKNVVQQGMLQGFLAFPEVMRLVHLSAAEMFKNNEIQSILEENFDVVINGYIFSEIPFLFGKHFKCPIIILWPRATLDGLDQLVGNISPISAVHYGGIDRKMSYFERIKNMVSYLFTQFISYYLNYQQNNIYRETFPGEEYPPLDQLKRNVSLVLLNEHFTQSVPRPYVQNMIEVGGLQIKDKPSPLPEDIQKWLDNSPEGVIYLSMGSNFKFSYMSKEGIDVFKKAFGKLKQRILWTFDTDEMEGKPENVMIKKWFPQDDLLAHPNIKIFISHGGLGSVVESKYHGVPIIGIPQFGDQEQNVNGIVAEGWALKISKDNVTEDSLGGAIEEMLKNSAYSSKVKELSFLYRDRPKTALETAVFWVEYVIRHKGAPHMRFQGVDLNFFQKNSLDVLAFLSFIIYIIYRLIKLFFVILCKLVCGRRKKEKIN